MRGLTEVENVLEAALHDLFDQFQSPEERAPQWVGGGQGLGGVWMTRRGRGLLVSQLLQKISCIYQWLWRWSAEREREREKEIERGGVHVVVVSETKFQSTV